MSIHDRPSALVRQPEVVVHWRKRPWVSVVVLLAIFVMLAFVFLVPLYWMTVSSLRAVVFPHSTGV
jgi:ABC-type glycerol-3-phosphate transport system permease component